MNKLKDKILKSKSLGIFIILVALVIAGGYYSYTKTNDNGNHLPEIIYASPSNNPTYTSGTNSHNTIDKLVATITDKEGDLLSISVWINFNGSWNGVALFEGHNGTYITYLNHEYNLSNSMNYEWRINIYDQHSLICKVYQFWNP